MGQKFFISFNSADRTKAHWIAWTLKEAGHEVAVHDWEIPAGGNAPLWMNTKLAWADRLIAVISLDYIPARYSPIEWASQIWNDPDGTKGSVIPVIVRPISKIPPLLEGLSRIDLTNCSEDEARRRLIKGVDIPAPPELKPEFEKVLGEPPDSQHVGPAEKPAFFREFDDSDIPPKIRWYLLSEAEWVQIPPEVRTMLKQLEGLSSRKENLVGQICCTVTMVFFCGLQMMVIKAAALGTILCGSLLVVNYTRILIFGKHVTDHRVLRARTNSSERWEMLPVMDLLRQPRELVRFENTVWFKDTVIRFMDLVAFSSAY